MRGRRFGHAKAVRVPVRPCLARAGPGGQAEQPSRRLVSYRAIPSMLNRAIREASHGAVSTRTDERVTIVTIERPERRNAAGCRRAPFDSARDFFDLFASEGGLEAMGSDPGDRDDPAALRARLDRLSSELKGRAAPPPAPGPKREAKPDGAGSAMSLGLRAGHRRPGHRLGSRSRARHQSCVSDCVFHAWRRGGGLERDSADFAQRGVIDPQFALVSHGLAG